MSDQSNNLPGLLPRGAPPLPEGFDYFEGAVVGEPAAGDVAVWARGWRSGWKVVRFYEPQRGISKALRRGSEVHRLSFEKAERVAENLTKGQRVIQIPDPVDSWAQVELWRWQYGELPGPDDLRPLSVSEGLLGMAQAIEKRDPNNFPSPMNVVAVLRYAAKLIPE